jgi:hypothetical protein
MGWNTVGLRVSGSVSSHNSERDDQDEALWTELHDRIVELCADTKYEQITPMVF